MNLLRVWPKRYCPVCGGPALRANNPLHSELRLGFLAGSGELPVWVGLGAGVLLATVFGKVVGIAAGIAVVLALCAFWGVAIVRLQRRHLVCECEDCQRVFRFEQLLKSRSVSRKAD
jgi:hypothetical protein